ncbi:hypothetical protein NQ315_013713, partial [Exocentrus adspersus]
SLLQKSVDTLLVPPSESQLEMIRNDINEDKDRLQHKEKLLQTWLNYRPHFPKNYDRKVVRSFLRNCKHDMEKVKTKLECYYATRHLYQELYSNRSTFACDIIQALDTINMVPLPKLNAKGSRIFVFKLENTDPETFDVHAATKLFLMIYDLLLTSEHPVAGDIALFDGADIGPNHFVKFLSVVKTITAILREAYAIRLKQVHVINASPLVDKIINVIKPLLHRKVRETFINHTSTKTLYNYFSEEILPSNYGGNCKPLRELMNDWREILKRNEDWFLEQESVKITESIPKKSTDNLYSDDFSIQGSFRSLQID